MLEQRAGFHDMCGGWTDGHDAIADRVCDAFKDGDVLLVIDSPGGAHAGLEEAIKRVLNAKEAMGRRVYAFADEQIGSAAYWWAAAIADEIYLPVSGVVGSIGARAVFQSAAKALQRDGISTTYFVYPGPGKAAFAPEFPLDKTAESRGTRDVRLAGRAFVKAVAMGRGLSTKEIIALDADCLTGRAAVDAGLADGVASIEDVIEHALANSQESYDEMGKQTSARAGEYEREERYVIKEKFDGDDIESMDEDAMDEDAEGMDPDEDAMDPEAMDDDPETPAEAMEPDAEAEPDPDADEEEEEEEDEEILRERLRRRREMAEEEEEDEYDDVSDEDERERMRAEGDEYEERRARAQDDDEDEVQARMSARRRAPKRRASGNSLAGILGLPSRSSNLAVRNQARALMGTLSRTMSVLGVRSMRGLVGAAKAAAEDAKRVGKVHAKNKELRREMNARKRRDLAMALIKRGAVDRSDLFLTKVVSKADGTTKRVDKLQPEWQRMPISDFESYAKRKLAGTQATSTRRVESPFSPDRSRAEEPQQAMNLEAAMKNPIVIDMAQRGNGDVEKYAKAWLITESQNRDPNKRIQAGNPAA